MTTTTTARWRAQTDPSTKTWHLGTEELGAKCVCGTRLIEPGDTRAFALKVPAEKRDYQTDPDVAKVTCGSCKRNREYATATGSAGNAALAPTGPHHRLLPLGKGRLSVTGGYATAPPLTVTVAVLDTFPGNTRAADAEEAGRPSRRRARTGDPRADRAAADLAAAADRAAVEPRRRPSRADRAHAKMEEDRARREADAAGPLPLPDLDQLEAAHRASHRGLTP